MCSLYPNVPIIINNFQQKDFADIVLAVCSVISPVFAIIISLYTFIKSKKKSELNKIQDLNAEIIRLAINYPYFEDDEFCKTWDGDYYNSKRKLRYYNYCCLVFNLIERIYTFTDGNREKMKAILYFNEYVSTHKIWWQTEIPKTGGYSEKFVCFINDMIKEEAHD